LRRTAINQKIERINAMQPPTGYAVVPVATAGDQEEVVMTGAAVPTVGDYADRFVCLYTDISGIRYRNDGTAATGAAPSKSLKAGERFFDFIPPGGGLSFFGAAGTVEIIPFG
jgi:hypothetical protein